MHLYCFFLQCTTVLQSFIFPPFQRLNKDNTLRSRKQTTLGTGMGVETGTGGGGIRKARLRRLELQQ